MRTNKIPIQYPIERSPLYNLRRKKKLEQLLGISLYELYHLDSDQSYHDFSIPKKDGSTRDVSAPDRSLKLIQKRLLKILQRIESPEWLTSGKKGKSYIDNTRFHLGAENVLTIDIRKFYNNCKHKYIYHLFVDVFKTSPDVAYLLCKLTSHFWKLPTGAPTSQLLAFWAYRDTFSQINAIAAKYGCKFSLYVDDMTFSSKDKIPVPLLLEDVSSALHGVGHRMKYSKIIHYQSGKAKLITGAIIDKDNILRVPNKLHYSIITDLKSLKMNILSDKDRVDVRSSLLGRIHVAQTIEAGIFPEALKYTKSLKTSK